MPAIETPAANVENTTPVEATPATVEAPKAPAKKAVKKAAKAAPAKPAKAPKKAPVKKAAKASSNGAGRAKKDGLRSGQERILKVLAKGKELTRGQIAEKAEVDSANCTELIGSLNEEVREANDKKHYPSLITLKYVKVVPGQDKEGKSTTLYAITASGKAVAEKLGK